MNTKQKCESIIYTAIKKGYLHQISHNKLKDAIAEALYLIDDRSLDKWEKALFRFGYIEQPTLGVYKWNWQKLTEIPSLKQLTLQQAQIGVGEVEKTNL